MFLTDHDMQHALERVQNAFPSFRQWTYTNGSDDERSLDGFALWGQWVLYPEETMARHFYVTFATHAEHWSGHLTIGQHYYWWTSADVGDAHLLDTVACATLEDAIVALKAAIARLCHALSGACMRKGASPHEVAEQIWAPQSARQDKHHGAQTPMRVLLLPQEPRC